MLDSTTYGNIRTFGDISDDGPEGPAVATDKYTVVKQEQVRDRGRCDCHRDAAISIVVWHTAGIPL